MPRHLTLTDSITAPEPSTVALRDTNGGCGFAGVTVYNGDGRFSSLHADNLTADHLHGLPDAPGTLALTSQSDGSITPGDIAGVIPLTKGGTGGTDASTARTNLGLGTGDSVTFTEVNLPGGVRVKSNGNTTEMYANNILALTLNPISQTSYLRIGGLADRTIGFFGATTTINYGGNATLVGGIFYIGQAADTCLRRVSTGLLALDAGVVNQFRDLKLRNLIATQYLEGEEMTAPTAPAANGYRIFAEDNGAGKTRLMVQFATGAAQQIAIEP